jgi:putative ABC transport system permease protein
LKRHKLFTFINITGLTFSIGFLILIGQFIYFEFSYNKEITNIENIYRLVDADGNDFSDYDIDYRIQDLITEIIPSVKNSCILNISDTEVNTKPSAK